MDALAAIRTRRTHKSFGPDPVPRAVLEELFDLARYAPNHHLTQPWRFRVLGPEALARLKEAAGPADAPKLERAPTLVVASARLAGEELQDDERVLGLIHLGSARSEPPSRERDPVSSYLTFLD